MLLNVNFVIGKDHGSKIFRDIFYKFSRSNLIDLYVTETPSEAADIYHYHRPQLEVQIKHPFVATVHHDLRDIDPFVAFHKFISMYNKADGIICLNHNQKEILNARGIQNTTVIPHGFDDNLLRPTPHRKRGGKFTLGIFSRRYERRVKGEAYLYELANHLPHDLFNFVLIGEDRTMDAVYLRDLGFEVTCFEWIPYKLFNDAYSRIDALMICSLYEGGPASLPEAISLALPVVSTPVGMVNDYIRHNYNGLILSGIVKDDVSNIIKLATNNIYYQSIKCNCMAVTYPYTWDRVITEHIDYYNRIIKIYKKDLT